MEHRIVKDDEGVSPVIAVILMVAITVVLAAVLYVWAASFLEQGENAPIATFYTQQDSDKGYQARTTRGIQLFPEGYQWLHTYWRQWLR